MPLTKLGPYRIERQLGRGGMGTVYAGVHEETGQAAAIKVLSPLLADNPHFRERFVAEIETLKKLKHPNIVELYGYGEEDDHLFYSMELVHGRSLGDELQAGRRFTWREVARVGIEVCLALKHAHDHGVVHRDLKPANLLLADDGPVKLTDFGIAKLYGVSNITAVGSVVGTADYMSPEQAEGTSVSFRSDLFSLGSVLYALLSGQPPFAAKVATVIFHNLKHLTPTPVQRLNPDTPQGFAEIIDDLLAKDPEKRPATALLVANRLKAMVFALSVHPEEADYSLNTVVESPPNVSPPTADQATSLYGPQPAPGQLTQAGTAVTAEQISVPDPGLTKAATSVLPPTPTAAPPSRVQRFTTVDERERRRAVHLDAESPAGSSERGKTMSLAAALVLIVAALIWGFWPPSAEQLFQQIQAAADANNLNDVRSTMARFLQQFPSDPRCPEIRDWQLDLECSSLQSRLRLRVLQRGELSLEPVEKLYLDGMSLKTREPAVAREKFQAVIGECERQPSLAEYHAAARHQLKRMGE